MNIGYDVIGRAIRNITKRCERCGAEYDVSDRIAWRSKYCPACRRKVQREKMREYRDRGFLRLQKTAAKERADGRAEYFATRDRLYAKSQSPTPARVSVEGDVRVETRGRCCGTATGSIDTSANHARRFV